VVVAELDFYQQVKLLILAVLVAVLVLKVETYQHPVQEQQIKVMAAAQMVEHSAPLVMVERLAVELVQLAQLPHHQRLRDLAE
jgi:hypothetical protein